MEIPAVVFIAVIFFAAQVQCETTPGFTVSNTSILDAKGNEFVMRGINYAHTWFKPDLARAIPTIAATGANVVRIVLSNGERWYRDDEEAVKRVLDVCEQNKLIAMLEVHDELGVDAVWRLGNAARYWVRLASLLQGREDRVIINVANEWCGSYDSAIWAEGYKTVIPRLRDAGLRHLLVVDAAGWGQDAASIVEKGKEVLDADPLKNVVFAIHMYEKAAPDAATVKKNIDDSLAVGAPVIIAEFSDAHDGKQVAYRDILKYTQEINVGWLAWSWYGNDASTANMDLAKAPDGELTALGKEIVEGENGIRATSKPASIW